MRKFDSINVIPFIDIMLVLLAIVLTTATFINSGQLDINLPEAASESSAPSTDDKLEIAIDQQLTLYLDDQVVSMDSLRAELTERSVNTAVLLRIDETVPFNQFIAVLDLLKQLKLDNVSVLTDTVDAMADDTDNATRSSGTDN